LNEKNKKIKEKYDSLTEREKNIISELLKNEKEDNENKENILNVEEDEKKENDKANEEKTNNDKKIITL
jgi:hypothetical protein